MDDDHSLSPFGGQRQIVSDQQQRGTQFIGEALQMIEHLPLHRDVECGRRLVGDQQLRVTRQSDGDQRTLAHAAG